MVWILNEVNNVVEVPLGSPAMNAAANVFETKERAVVAQRAKCAHETKIGHRGTGHIQCADCGTPFN